MPHWTQPPNQPTGKVAGHTPAQHPCTCTHAKSLQGLVHLASATQTQQGQRQSPITDRLSVNTIVTHRREVRRRRAVPRYTDTTRDTQGYAAPPLGGPCWRHLTTVRLQQAGHQVELVLKHGRTAGLRWGAGREERGQRG